MEQIVRNSEKKASRSAEMDVTRLTRAPISDAERKQLKADVANLRDAATRKGVTLDAWEERSERTAGKIHFELGCWLFYYHRRIGRQDGLADRIDCARRIFAEGIHNPGYQFFTAFNFGERQFDTIFEMGDADLVINGLRKHLKSDSAGTLASAFQNFGWSSSMLEVQQKDCAAAYSAG